MTADNGFLSRWARRKAEVQRQETEAAIEASAETVATATATTPEGGEPAFDVANLPSIDSLSADSTVAAFLSKGVPLALQNAALRKMWVTDPSIRDYVGLADFQWDFNAPGSISGFGDLEAGTDLGKMIADLTEFHLNKADIPAAEPDTATADTIDAASKSESLASADVSNSLPPDKTDGSGLPGVEHEVPPRRRPRHGGATPV